MGSPFQGPRWPSGMDSDLLFGRLVYKILGTPDHLGAGIKIILWFPAWLESPDEFPPGMFQQHSRSLVVKKRSHVPAQGYLKGTVHDHGNNIPQPVVVVGPPKPS